MLVTLKRFFQFPGWFTIFALALAPVTVLRAEQPDIRRDAAVRAVERVMPSVVNIGTETVVQVHDPYEDLLKEFWGPYYRKRPPNTQYSLGSGVIIDEDGYLLTNFHVVGRATRIWVKLADGREFQAEPVVGTSLTDVALLKIKAKPDEKFQAVKFAADDDLLLGETVLALGNPFGLGGSVSRGILSSKSRRPPSEDAPLDVLDWLQTDAAINPGNSGGPLINLRGELIGLNVAMVREGQGIGFAVPVKRILTALSEIFTPETLKSYWFGARVRPGALPLVVTEVQEGSPADRAGLQPADKIVEVNGHRPAGYIAFIQELANSGLDKPALFDVQRGSEHRQVRVRLVKESDFFNAELIRKKTGLTLQELTPELADSFGFREKEGLLVAGVDRKSPADVAQLQSGWLITSVDGEHVDSLVKTAKKLYAKDADETAKLGVIVPRQFGRFVQLLQGSVELKVQ